MDPRRLLARLARGDVANVSFYDLRRLVEMLGSSCGGRAGATTSSFTLTFQSFSTCRKCVARRSLIKFASFSAWSSATLCDWRKTDVERLPHQRFLQRRGRWLYRRHPRPRGLLGVRQIARRSARRGREGEGGVACRRARGRKARSRTSLSTGDLRQVADSLRRGWAIGACDVSPLPPTSRPRQLP